MKPDVVLEVLEAAAEQLGIKVSYETLMTAGIATGGVSFRGGLCRVKGERRIIVDKRATSEERVTTLATALAGLDTNELELPPKVREVLRMHEPSARHRRTAA
jgi:hypothetical protein